MIRDEDRSLAEAIGRRARGHRQRLGATQEQIAELVGLSTQVYARMERGGVLPSLRTLTRVAEALSTHPGDLLAEVGERRDHSPSTRPAKAGAGEFNALVRYAEQLDPATRAHLVGLLKKMVRAR